ncbi:MAG: hypothetical protein HY553_04480 [Elusimicrobia bacterium]|nr:hypothetical protein [Elusimicrobiota bacterium]
MRRILTLLLVPALVLVAATLVRAARLQGDGGTIQAQNTNQLPTCSLICQSQDPRGLPTGYCNGREAYLTSGLSPGNIRVSWSSQFATSITLDRGDGTGAQTVAASGSEDHFMGQSSWRPFTFYVSNESGSCGPLTVYGRTSCFLKGTKILMADGTYKNIEEIQAGEVVMGYDTETGTFKSTTVTKPIQSSTSRWFLVNDNLKISVGHQIMANGQWTWSDNLKVGDVLFDAGGNEVKITSLVTHDEVVDVYNLITDPYHNFFAGSTAQSFLVHNKNTIEGHENKGLVRGMEVLLVDGRRVKVENLKAGDKIMNYDFKNKRYVPGTVRLVDSQKVQGYVVINGALKVAKKHTLYSVKEADFNKTLPKKATKK